MKTLGTITAAVLAVLLGIAALYGLVVALGPLGRIVNDITRENTQHSQAYVESKTQLLNGLITDYESPAATDGQKVAIVNEFCYQVTLLVPSERPANVVRFQTAHC